MKEDVINGFLQAIIYGRGCVQIVTINDSMIYIEDEENFLTSYDVETTASTLFYFREDTGSDRQPLNFHTTEEEKKEVERV